MAQSWVIVDFCGSVQPNEIDSVDDCRRTWYWCRPVFYKKEAPALSAEAELAVRKLYFVVDRLLEGASNLFGEWCIADTDLALMLNRLVINGDNVPTKFASYATRQWDRDCVQQWAELSRPPL